MDQTISLKEKFIWDLNEEECEYVYHDLHMDNYVYAAFKTFHTFKYPLNKKMRIIKDNIPSYMHEEVQSFVQLAQFIGKDDPGKIRINYTCNAYKLFTKLKFIKNNEINNIIELLSALAYIAIIADKNDNLPVWRNPIVRVMENKRFSIEEITSEIKKNDHVDYGIQNYQNENTLNLLFKCTPIAVQEIIIMIENNFDKNVISDTFFELEKFILDLELKNNIGNKNIFLGGVKYPGQLRYRNTLYLYGGNHFERIGDYETAFDWYTKDIYFYNIVKLLGYYLTALKTCERFLCAYRISDKLNKDLDILKEILNKCLLSAFKDASICAEIIIDNINNNPGIDLSNNTIPNRTKIKTLKIDNLPFAGEPAIEIFLFALLYNEIINNINYADINYKKYFIIED